MPPVIKRPVTCCQYTSTDGDTFVTCTQGEAICADTIRKRNKTFSNPVRSLASNCGECRQRKIRPS